MFLSMKHEQAYNVLIKKEIWIKKKINMCKATFLSQKTCVKRNSLITEWSCLVTLVSCHLHFLKKNILIFF